MRLIDELMAHPLLEERHASQVLGPLGFDIHIAREEVPYADEEPVKREEFCRDPDSYMAALTFSIPARFTELARFDTEDAEIVMLAVRPFKPLANLLLLPVDEAPLSATIEGAPTQASADVLAERRRQIEQEGWSREHDDAHGKGEMARAAASYAGIAALHVEKNSAADGSGFLTSAWPWAAHWGKPTTARRNLVKAGALILAEIERLDRQAERAREENS